MGFFAQSKNFGLCHTHKHKETHKRIVVIIELLAYNYESFTTWCANEYSTNLCTIDNNVQIDGQTYAIGWIEFAHCFETNQTKVFDLTYSQIITLANLGNTVKITLMSGDDPNVTVISKLDNYVIKNLRYGNLNTHTHTHIHIHTKQNKTTQLCVLLFCILFLS